MKVLTLIVSTILLPVVALAQNPPPSDPGPFYFSNNRPAPHHRYWGGTSYYGGILVVENYNLLATVLGDQPRLSSGFQLGSRLVGRESFDFGDGSVVLQPFAYYQQIGMIRTHTKGLPIGRRLAAFLNDPLRGASFDLTLPFNDPRVALSDRSAILRVSNQVPNTGDWHVAVDLDVSRDTSQGFDVLAPADGVVEGNGTTDTLCLRHTASNGREFLTIYAHMVPESKSQLSEGDPVSRGQLLGRVQEAGYTHLHFGVAVRGPGRRVNGVRVPKLWYLIDPFGVYDYRRNSSSETDYNYLPNNTLRPEVRGVRHAYVWRTNPPFGSIPFRLVTRPRGS